MDFKKTPQEGEGGWLSFETFSLKVNFKINWITMKSKQVKKD